MNHVNGWNSRYVYDLNVKWKVKGKFFWAVTANDDGSVTQKIALANLRHLWLGKSKMDKKRCSNYSDVQPAFLKKTVWRDWSCNPVALTDIMVDCQNMTETTN